MRSLIYKNRDTVWYQQGQFGNRWSAFAKIVTAGDCDGIQISFLSRLTLN